MLDDKLIEIAESLADKVNEKDWDEYSEPKVATEMYSALVDFVGRCDVVDYMIELNKALMFKCNYCSRELKLDLKYFKEEKSTKNRLNLMISIMIFTDEEGL